MGVEQAIFTACEAGITRQSPGFQIYSYSSGMEQILKDTNSSMMFQYEQPNYGLRPIFEKLDYDSYPIKFAYSIVEEERKLVCFAMNRMVEESRYGNYFSHLLATNLQTLNAYPCEYYKSPLFLEGLTREQKESKKKPDLLYKRTSMERGEAISYATVRKFLLQNNRLTKLKRVVAALLSTTDEENGKQKVILFDENDGTSNAIIYWIAAITMALPLKSAKRISFSDYEYEPLASPYKICGCLREGTRYDREAMNEQCFVFDFSSNTIPSVNTDSELYDVIELSYRVSRDCISDFHVFMEDYNYEGCDKQLLDAYELYKLLNVPEYITKITRQRLHNAFHFANLYAKESVKQNLITNLLTFIREQKSIENRVIRELLYFFEVQIKEGRLIKERLILPLLRILYESLAVSTKEEKNYVSLQKSMVYFFEQVDLSLYKYYLGSLPTKETLLLLRKTSYEWKLKQAEELIKNYLLVMKPTVSELTEDTKFNALILVLLSRCYLQCPSGKLLELSDLIKTFSFDYSYSTYLYLTIRRYFGGMEGAKLMVAVAEYHYARYYYELEEKEKVAVLSYLMMEDEIAVVMLYHYEYEKEEQFMPWFKKVTTFIEEQQIGNGKLLDALLAEAFQNALEKKENRYQSVESLFHYTFKIGYRERFVNRLVPYLSASIPLVVTDEEQLSLIKKLYFYQVNYNGGLIEKRVALCYRLFELREFLNSHPKKRERITFSKLVSIPTMDGMETSNYLKRAGNIIGEIIYYNGQVNLLRTCYYLRGEKEQQFYLYVYEALLNKGRRHKEYMMFLHTFVYAMEDTRADSLATLLVSSGAKIKDINEELHGNIQHLVAFRRMFDPEGAREERILRRWKIIKAKCLGKPC